MQFAKEKGEAVRTWRVQKIASKGQVFFREHIDASSADALLFGPTVAGLMQREAKKISIDPIGRVHKAGD